MIMAGEKKLYPCIKVGDGDIAPRVLTCGDPVRAQRIGDMLEDSRCLARNREYWTFSGTHKGVPVTVCSHGVGCGGALIGFEGLCRAGAKLIIRVGTCGALQPGIKPGSGIIADAACREEGVTEKLVPLAYPAVANAGLNEAMEKAAAARGRTLFRGIIVTQALFYPGLLEGNLTLYAKAGVLAMENEAAGLFVAASLHGVKAAAILTVDAPAFGLVDVAGYQPDEDEVAKMVDEQTKIALDAIVSMECI
jgi:uridine phosphorylase